MTIGGVPFDVTRGVQRQMVQQVVAVVPPPPALPDAPPLAPKLAVLGDLGSTLCVVPDVEAVLSAMQRERRGAVPESYAAMAETLRSAKVKVERA